MGILNFNVWRKGSSDLQLVAYGIQLRKHLLSFCRIGGTVNFDVEIILPGMLPQGTASQGSHVVAVLADDGDGIRQRTCLMLDREHQNGIG